MINNSIKSLMTTKLARACLFALAVGAASPAFAVPLMDMRIDDLLFIASDVKQSLNLTPNQQTLWNQTEGRTRGILRDRQRRRDALQAGATALAAKPNVELRDLSAAVEAESATTSAENKQLRELWLVVNDALDDKQRAQVAVFMGEQLMRVIPEGHSSGKPDGNSDKGSGGRSGGHGRGGMGGMGGGMGGGSGGPGGASINLGG